MTALQHAHRWMQGLRGSLGYADPVLGLGYGYVTNRMGMHLQGDPRDVALRAALARRTDT